MNKINLNYNYVYFNNSYLIDGKIYNNEYNSICVKDLCEYEDIKVIPCPLAEFPWLLRKIYSKHNSIKINSKIKLPFKNVWYPFLYKNEFKDKKPICFIFASTDLPIKYTCYLRKKYPKCKIIKLHRDLVKICHLNPDYSEDNLNKYFDFRLTYDYGEAEKYGIKHFCEIESKIDVKRNKEYLSDVFFAGKAKDRFAKILCAYKVLTEAGLKCDFYITEVKQKERVKLPGIEYADEFMPYDAMLYKTVNSRCILDINQSGASGYTSRIIEAIIYNKKLISDNKKIIDSKYYNEKFMQYIENMSEIDTQFVKNDIEIDYCYKNDFSPINLLRKIDSLIMQN